ncbi:MAG: hypothetical protein QM765_23610 [Myxococcales bacterium]
MDSQLLETSAPAADPELRRLLWGLLVASPFVGLLPLAWSWRQLSAFSDRVRRLASDQDLVKFRAMVRLQMYGALLQIAVLLAPMALLLAGILLGALTPGDSYLPIGAFLVVFLAGMAVRRLEKRVQRIPCETPALEKARDSVVQTWLHKPLPDWKD